jgi:glucokinase
MILAGDIGGTKSNLALFSENNLRAPVVEHTFRSKDYAGLEDVIRAFLAQTASGQVSRACFGIAGPVVGGECRTPNLPWIITTRGLKDSLSIDAVRLINDLEATGYGVALLNDEELVTLNEGSPRSAGNAALIAAGTGLGEATLHWEGTKHGPVASEGGHSDFAPRNAVEIELLQYLLKRFDHVSYERVLSGPGLFNIYSFLQDAGHGQEEPWLTEKLNQGDPSAVVSEAALTHQSELCVRALDMFASIYGAEAGNLALKALAVTGVYVGGGIAPKIIDKLRDGTFMRAFVDKGRLAPLLKTIPVRVILNPQTALYGAARCATLM